MLRYVLRKAIRCVEVSDDTYIGGWSIHLYRDIEAWPLFSVWLEIVTALSLRSTEPSGIAV